MLIDRTHRGWIVFTILALLASTGYYVIYHVQSYSSGSFNGPSGSTWTGLTYGAIGFVLMIFCGLLGMRRRVRVWKIGRGQDWLRAHIWLGLIAYPLILYHAGMKFGFGLTLWMMILFTIVLISGIVGILLQNILPRTMLVRVQAETTFEQIPHVIGVLRNEADQIVSSVCGMLDNQNKDALAYPDGGSVGVMKREGAMQGKVIRTKSRSVGVLEGSAPLKTFYLNEVQPFLSQDFNVENRLSEQRSAIALFSHARTLVPDNLHETLKDLESVCEERRQLALQVRLHYWLHLWEFLHIPLSYALLAMSAVHAVVAVIKY